MSKEVISRWSKFYLSHIQVEWSHTSLLQTNRSPLRLSNIPPQLTSKLVGDDWLIMSEALNARLFNYFRPFQWRLTIWKILVTAHRNDNSVRNAKANGHKHYTHIHTQALNSILCLEAGNGEFSHGWGSGECKPDIY